MKKNYLILPVLTGLLLTACGGQKGSSSLYSSSSESMGESSLNSSIDSSSSPSISSEPVKDYYIITFKYNLENNDGTYLSWVVGKETEIVAPKDPESPNLVFKYWSLDKEGTKEYKRWGLYLESDITLYAQWKSFDTLDIDDSIAKFQEKVASLGQKASRTIETVSAKIAYPEISEKIFFVEDTYVYTRYKDLTEKEYYYQNEEDGTKVKYGVRQYYYDVKNFINIYKDLENGDIEKKTSKYSEENEENFLSIDPVNLTRGVQDSIVAYSNSDKYSIDDGTLEIEFTGNYTLIDNTKKSYVYKEGYSAATYSENLGEWATTIESNEVGLHFTDGVITGAAMICKKMIVLGESSVQYYEENVTQFEFYYNNGVFEDFTGTLLV